MRSLLIKPELYTATKEGRKTNTRRRHGLNEINENPGSWQLLDSKSGWTGFLSDIYYATFTHKNRTVGTSRMIRAKYRKNEVLYLAEPHWVWKKNVAVPAEISNEVVYFSLNDVPEIYHSFLKKLSPLFLAERFAREFIKITDIRIERIRDISEEDSVNEGIDFLDPSSFGTSHPVWKCYTGAASFCTTASGSFASLWEITNGKESWKKNEWVWVYHYEYLVEKSRTA